ncbi:ankyrin repeat domain-containing protein [Pseudocolwellia agarivorans]|uniref:ankyrin repeat domain-containing protein n=1 Tax=Pseudocolwellia agarivorans TaxID=1911682 RepID=UPI0009857BE7|nr:ankyrin repeat domain-containing protein [Pseudocolwellia agarivorans]
MNSVNPTLIISLVAAMGLFVYLKLSNPYQQYSTEAFWKSATIADVYEIPAAALHVNNKNGPVIMWAASVTNDPKIISALISRGADVNERDIDFHGTALSAASYQNTNPQIIDELVKQGAEVNIVLGRLKKSPLLLAAEKNTPAVTERLLFHGANAEYRDANERTAYIQALKSKNKDVIAVYEKIQNKNNNTK